MSGFSNYLSTIFPSYVPQYGNFPQFTIWNTSFLMYFMIYLTVAALIMVTIMDKDGKNSSGSSFYGVRVGPSPAQAPGRPVPSAPPAPLGPKIPTSGGKKRKTYKHK